MLVTVANDHFLDQWRHTHRLQNEPITPADTPQTPVEPFDDTPPAAQSRPPPAPLPQNPPPHRSAQPTVGFAMPNGRISLPHQRPDTTRAFPATRSAVTKPGRTRFGNPRNDKIPPDRDDQTGSRQLQSSRFKNGPLEPPKGIEPLTPSLRAMLKRSSSCLRWCLVGHSSTAVTELVYRKQIRPVLQEGAVVMDRIFKK
ncbi:hypothetical protein [Microbispora sp. KK1-11]|uniref:hypothetical protein n=1 Tax=Microbispora sp. KK1-11 TaxID=2053005 RepID=UPI0011588689|nr:hypothetical protein [Microbispora sp. KK1-11]TQS19863.1 hypothetical protein FLW16_41305 [Microbispora sp. KK1-11]